MIFNKIIQIRCLTLALLRERYVRSFKFVGIFEKLDTFRGIQILSFPKNI